LAKLQKALRGFGELRLQRGGLEIVGGVGKRKGKRHFQHQLDPNAGFKRKVQRITGTWLGPRETELEPKERTGKASKEQ